MKAKKNTGTDKEKGRTPATKRAPRKDDARPGSRSATRIDRLVGANIRHLRIARNLTLADMAARLGISHQQLQKYETGANRLSAGMLHAVAAQLQAPLALLYEDAEDMDAQTPVTKLDQLREECSFLLGQIRSEETMRQVSRVLRAMS